MSNTDENIPADFVKDKWPGRILIALGSILLLFFLLKGCLWFIVPNGGHMFDSYEVVSTIPSPDGQLNAVEYKYTYAELSIQGLSMWFMKGKAPAIGSKDIPSGQPAFTYLARVKDIHWAWNSNAKLEVRFSGSADIETTPWPAGCFWDYTQPILCLHSRDVVIKKD